MRTGPWRSLSVFPGLAQVCHSWVIGDRWCGARGLLASERWSPASGSVERYSGGSQASVEGVGGAGGAAPGGVRGQLTARAVTSSDGSCQGVSEAPSKPGALGNPEGRRGLGPEPRHPRRHRRGAGGHVPHSHHCLCRPGTRHRADTEGVSREVTCPELPATPRLQLLCCLGTQGAAWSHGRLHFCDG